MKKIKAKLFLVSKKKLDPQPYLVTDEEIGVNQLCLFVIERKEGGEKRYVVGLPDDFLGSPIKEVYKVIAEPDDISLTKRELEEIMSNDGNCEIEADEIPDLQSYK